MKLYRIKDWNKDHENNRSRTVKDLSWVAVPNRHDGEGYSLVMAHQRASEIFTAWVLMLQVASRCQPRGSLLRDNGRPHTGDSLALKTRGKREWFEIALQFLSSPDVSWLVCDEVPEIPNDAPACQEPVSVPPVSRQSGDEGGEGKEGREGSESARAGESVEAHLPSPKEIIDFGAMRGVPRDYCEHYHAVCTEKHRWLVKSPGGERVIVWRSELVRWWTRDRENWGKPNGRGAKPPSIEEKAILRRREEADRLWSKRIE